MKHVWKETGEALSYCSDPPTLRERCELCGSLCWHYTGIHSQRYRRRRDGDEQITREIMLTPPVAVAADEPCAGRPVSREESLRGPDPWPSPVEPPLPSRFVGDPDAIVAKPRWVKSQWSDTIKDDLR